MTRHAHDETHRDIRNLNNAKRNPSVCLDISGTPKREDWPGSVWIHMSTGDNLTVIGFHTTREDARWMIKALQYAVEVSERPEI